MVTADSAGAVAAWAAVASAFVALVSAVVALIGIRAESRAGRRSLAVDILIRYEERFDASPMRTARRACAEFLMYHWGHLAEADDESNVVAPVLDFFEPIGVLTHQKVLDQEMVDTYFGEWILVYWRVCKPYVERSRTKRPTVWEGTEYLYDSVLKVQFLQVRRAALRGQNAFERAKERLSWLHPDKSAVAVAGRDDDECKQMLEAEAKLDLSGSTHGDGAKSKAAVDALRVALAAGE